MLVKYIVIAVALVGLSGLATAGPAGEEALKLDLTAAGGSTFFLKCSKSTEITNCGIVSLWEQTNKLSGLQTTIFAYGGVPHQPDAKLLG